MSQGKQGDTCKYWRSTEEMLRIKSTFVNRNISIIAEDKKGAEKLREFPRQSLMILSAVCINPDEALG